MSLKPDISTELRTMVREVLREVIPQKAAASGVETVRLSNDAELAAFVSRLIEPETNAAVRAGRLRFTLGSAASTPASQLTSGVLQGVISEQKISKLAAGDRVLIAADAVLTPLARDKARRLGLKIERSL